jgi:hypothetical protein
MPNPECDWITVVCGVPRSGTSLVMQMLAAGGLPVLADDARPPDAHNPRGYLEYAPVRGLRRDAGWLPLARGRAVKVVHALVSALPEGFEYRLVLVRRDLREVVASQDAMLGAERAPAPTAERLAEVFAAQLTELDAWLAARPHVPVLRLEHAALLADPSGAAAGLSVFLGGGLDEAAMAAAVDPALHRQRGS